jgi:5-enolpyruvylshikimate-3-phosphate synthase
MKRYTYHADGDCVGRIEQIGWGVIAHTSQVDHDDMRQLVDQANAAAELAEQVEELIATHELRAHKGERITPLQAEAMRRGGEVIAKARGEG